MISGYSGTPILKKLGIKEDMKIKLIGAPPEYYDLLQNDITAQLCRRKESPDLIHLFATDYNEFEKDMKKIKKNMKATTIIWVSWHKKSSGIITELTEDVIRNYALQNDLVDVKVCAVTEVWSGLKLVVPLAKR